MFRGQLTTGGMKLVGIGLACLIVAEIVGQVAPWGSPGVAVGSSALTRILAVLLAGASVALTSNLLNLLDLRPGRALKAYGLLIPFAVVSVAFGLGTGPGIDRFGARGTGTGGASDARLRRAPPIRPRASGVCRVPTTDCDATWRSPAVPQGLVPGSQRNEEDRRDRRDLTHFETSSRRVTQPPGPISTMLSTGFLLRCCCYLGDRPSSDRGRRPGKRVASTSPSGDRRRRRRRSRKPNVEDLCGRREVAMPLWARG